MQPAAAGTGVEDERRFVRRGDLRVLRIDLGLPGGCRAAHGGTEVSVGYAVAGVLALALMVYLLVALLKPEWFG
jgi:K+-transporting ATPase KdpF subunit